MHTHARAEIYGAGGVFYGILDVTGTYDSNIFVNSSELDDLIVTLSPAAQYIRDAGFIRTEAVAGLNISRYDDFDQFDAEEPFVTLELDMPFRDADYPLAARFNAEWADETIADQTVGDRVERARADIRARADYRIHERFVTWLGAGYENLQYDPINFSDFESVDVELGGGYRYSDNLNLGLSSRYRVQDREDRWVPAAGPGGLVRADGFKARDYAFFAVAEGQLLARTRGTVNVGAQYREFDHDVLEDSWSPFVRIAATWTADETTQWVLAVTSDFTSTAINESAESQSISLTLRQQLFTKIRAYVSAVAEQLEMEAPPTVAGGGVVTRDDDVWRLVTGVDYTLTELFSLHLDMSYEDRNSSSAFTDYDRFVTHLAFRGRF